MGIFRQFPYSNFHEMNLDEILKKIKELSDKWDRFYIDVVEKIKNEVDSWLDSHPEATTTVMDGAITESKIYPPFLNVSRVWVNVASMVDDYILTNDNIAQAILDALEISNYIYIPSGVYTFNVEIETDCTMILDDECIIKTGLGEPWNGQPVIWAHDCSFNMFGGSICCGENDASQIPVANWRGAIYLKDCHDSSITNLKSPYSKANSLIWIRNCINTEIKNCEFYNFLRAGIFICDSCKKITVRDCHFENSIPVNGQSFCYFVYTGVEDASPTARTTPVDGLIYENNYGIHSFDCGFDTHGATNVIIRNNTVLDTVCAITAYNDNLRVRRPEGWTMDNIIIENNYCESTRKNSAEAVSAGLPHPFLFIGSSNQHKPSDGTANPSDPTDIYYDWYGTYDAFRNCVIRNNVFKTNNDYPNGAIFLDYMSSNIIFENNNFYFDENSIAYIGFRNCMNFIFRNNITRSYSPAQNKRCQLAFHHCYGDIINNTGFKHTFPNNSDVNHVRHLDIEKEDSNLPVTVELGEVIYLNGAKITKSFGLRRRDANALSDLVSPQTFSISSGNGIATIDDNIYIPYLALSVTNEGGTTSNVYVKEMIDRQHFSVVDASGNPVSAGNYSATLRLAEFTSLT